MAKNTKKTPEQLRAEEIAYGIGTAVEQGALYVIKGVLLFWALIVVVGAGFYIFSR